MQGFDVFAQRALHVAQLPANGQQIGPAFVYRFGLLRCENARPGRFVLFCPGAVNAAQLREFGLGLLQTLGQCLFLFAELAFSLLLDLAHFHERTI